MTRFLQLFSFIWLLFSCSKNDVEPNSYKVQVKNFYFESVDSVKVGDYYLGKIEKEIISSPLSFTKGVYDFTCLTKSELRITAKINIQGLNETINIRLNEKGKVELE